MDIVLGAMAFILNKKHLETTPTKSPKDYWNIAGTTFDSEEIAKFVRYDR